MDIGVFEEGSTCEMLKSEKRIVLRNGKVLGVKLF